MARVTVEDCLLSVSDRFQLVILAAERTRNINSGASITVSRDGDKNSVVSLREIAGETISPSALQESLIRNFQQYFDNEEVSTDLKDLLNEEEKNWVHASFDAREAELLDFSKDDEFDSDVPLDVEDIY
ncbi:MAG: DNA-directed RNA polymerase subunit omega [Alphaproteobacteria bacterium]